MSEIIETAIHIFVFLLSFVFLFFLIVTLPIWIVPYVIYKRRKEREKK